MRPVGSCGEENGSDCTRDIGHPGRCKDFRGNSIKAEVSEYTERDFDRKREIGAEREAKRRRQTLSDDD